ncbi:CHAT domain-containing protein [Mongoliitalea daihaiensis]|uniref:CHAT domain-containing protein n=1 Tax=Mongoliitalea daihaiensis TaxID=2782006 RepID=UPI001F24F6B7|nr:CHAT domain-containing tetratricopeptide repeat protein [Mongoliitalea daihaiensis]UJP65910.1 CHAT domain-containing protein [Mongoliitalea daihaiensis]
MKKTTFIGLIWIFLPILLLGQTIDERLAQVQKSINEDKLDSAIIFFDTYTNLYIKNADYLNLSYFVPLAGFIGNKQKDIQYGMDRVQYWLDFLSGKTQDPRVLRQAHLESHRYFMFAGKIQMAYDANKRALDFTNKIPDHTPSEWAIIERNLGVLATQLNDFALARTHTLKALEVFDLDPNTSSESRFNILNDLGVSYWYASIWDSAEYYWKAGIAYLDQMEDNPTNQLYRKAMIEGNLAAVYDVKGKLDESVKMVKSSIANSKAFANQAIDDPKRDRAMLSIFYSSMNLGITYKSMGNYLQALHIHEHTLKEKEKYFPAGHPEITESLIMVGQVHSYLMNYGEAKKYLNRAIDDLNATEEKFPLRLADIYYTLALVAEGENEIDAAKTYHHTALKYFQQTNQESLDFVYLGFLGHAADFFSLHGEPDMAQQLSKMGYEYTKKTNGIQSLPGFHQVINKSRVSYNLGSFATAKTEAEEGMGILTHLLESVTNLTDSVRIEYEKPMAYLLKWKSDYRITQERSVSYLESMLKELRHGIKLLEKRKAMLSDSQDLGVLLSQNQELISFVKQIELELYEKTGQEKYLNQLIATHESSVYAKIRAQLNQQRQVRFSGVPESIIEEGSLIRDELGYILAEEGNIEEFMAVSSKWENHLKMLKSDYPAYYQSRYGDIYEGDLVFPKEKQIVRYLFVEENLKAIVINNGKKQLYSLNFNPELIKKLPFLWHDQKALGAVTYQLYQQLWQPFGSNLNDSNVVIIPDGMLFNLSFDLLTDKEIKTYEEFLLHSLLVKHDISYQYSMWFGFTKSSKNMRSNYVAFTPGFLDRMKENYLKSVRDSLSLDNAYLSLLPQPFTINLANKAAQTLGGNIFAFEESTAKAFREKAGKNKIIHIGTHAESNNISPVFSKLIFAKNGDPLEEDNALYAYQIYNTDMQSNLTLLTACETGKPVFQPGEGMVSLSHAFQFAGSESLLTSLWKVDEKSSMEITDYFLEFLSEGMAKDRALKEAKLKYLSTAKGRTLSPQYWAGMVLIGDVTPISDLRKGHNRIYLILGFTLFFALLFLFFKYRS